MAPGGDAVSLVDGEKRNVNRLECFQKPAAAKAFGSNVDQLELTATQGIDARPLLALSDRAIYEGRRKSARVERIHLILHERNEGRDDKR